MVNPLLLVVNSNTCCSGIHIDIFPLRARLTLHLITGRSRILSRIFYEIGLFITHVVNEHAQYLGWGQYVLDNADSSYF